jgi:hypothetical protein
MVTLPSETSSVRTLKAALSRKLGVPPSQQEIRRGGGLDNAQRLLQDTDVVVDAPKTRKRSNPQRKTTKQTKNGGDATAAVSSTTTTTVVSMVVIPLDSSLLMRRNKNLKHYITFDAWKLEDAKSLSQRRSLETRRRNEKAASEASKAARNRAAFSAWARKLKQERERVKVFAPETAVELAVELELELFSFLPSSSSSSSASTHPPPPPPLEGDEGGGGNENATAAAASESPEIPPSHQVPAVPSVIQRFRKRRVSTSDPLTVVSVAPRLAYQQAATVTCSEDGPSSGTTTTTTTHGGVDVNWYVVRTKDGWHAEVPSRWLLLPRKPPLSADEQYLFDASDQRRRQAEDVLRDRHKWTQRHQWRSLTKPPPPPPPPPAQPNSSGGGQVGESVSSSSSSAHAAKTEEGCKADAWVWLMKRLRGRSLCPRSIFQGIDKDRYFSFFLISLWDGVILPLSLFLFIAATCKLVLSLFTY